MILIILVILLLVSSITIYYYVSKKSTVVSKLEATKTPQPTITVEKKFFEIITSPPGETEKPIIEIKREIPTSIPLEYSSKTFSYIIGNGGYIYFNKTDDLFYIQNLNNDQYYTNYDWTDVTKPYQILQSKFLTKFAIPTQFTIKMLNDPTLVIYWNDNLFILKNTNDIDYDINRSLFYLDHTIKQEYKLNVSSGLNVLTKVYPYFIFNIKNKYSNISYSDRPLIIKDSLTDTTNTDFIDINNLLLILSSNNYIIDPDINYLLDSLVTPTPSITPTPTETTSSLSTLPETTSTPTGSPTSTPTVVNYDSLIYNGITFNTNYFSSNPSSMNIAVSDDGKLVFFVIYVKYNDGSPFSYPIIFMWNYDNKLVQQIYNYTYDTNNSKVFLDTSSGIYIRKIIYNNNKLFVVTQFSSDQNTQPIKSYDISSNIWNFISMPSVFYVNQTIDINFYLGSTLSIDFDKNGNMYYCNGKNTIIKFTKNDDSFSYSSSNVITDSNSILYIKYNSYDNKLYYISTKDIISIPVDSFPSNKITSLSFPSGYSFSRIDAFNINKNNDVMLGGQFVIQFTDQTGISVYDSYPLITYSLTNGWSKYKLNFNAQIRNILTNNESSFFIGGDLYTILNETDNKFIQSFGMLKYLDNTFYTYGTTINSTKGSPVLDMVMTKDEKYIISIGYGFTKDVNNNFKTQYINIFNIENNTWL